MGPGATLGAGIAAVVCASVGCGVDRVPTLTAAPPGPCAPYVPPDGTDPTVAPVSFTNDVVPLFDRSCAYADCHGAATDPPGGLGLGPDVVSTYAGLVGVSSVADPAVVRVKAGDPGGSLLQHKIDGDACTLAGCTGPCAASMPYGQDLMALTDRETIRAWIAQGALADFDDGGT